MRKKNHEMRWKTQGNKYLLIPQSIKHLLTISGFFFLKISGFPIPVYITLCPGFLSDNVSWLKEHGTVAAFCCVTLYLHSLVLCEFRNRLNNSFQMYLTKPAIVPCHQVFVIIDCIGCPIIGRFLFAVLLKVSALTPSLSFLLYPPLLFL